MRSRLIALLTTGMLVATMGIITAAPAAAHHDEEFTFGEVMTTLDRAIVARNWKNGNTIFNRGRALVHDIRGFRQHGPTPRWIPRTCRDETRELLKDAFVFGKVLSRYGRAKANNFRYAPRPYVQKLVLRSQVRASYRNLEDSLEAWEDCILEYGRLPRRFR